MDWNGSSLFRIPYPPFSLFSLFFFSPLRFFFFSRLSQCRWTLFPSNGTQSPSPLFPLSQLGTRRKNGDQYSLYNSSHCIFPPLFPPPFFLFPSPFLPDWDQSKWKTWFWDRMAAKSNRPPLSFLLFSSSPCSFPSPTGPCASEIQESSAIPVVWLTLFFLFFFFFSLPPPPFFPPSCPGLFEVINCYIFFCKAVFSPPLSFFFPLFSPSSIQSIFLLWGLGFFVRLGSSTIFFFPPFFFSFLCRACIIADEPMVSQPPSQTVVFFSPLIWGW